MQPPTQEGDLPVAGRRGQQEESRQERFLQELLNSPLLTVPLLHAAAEPGGLNESRSELPEQSVEAAAAALAAARRFLALRARQHLGTCETSTGASSSQQPAEQQPSKRSLWPRPPRMHVSEPVLQGSPGASSSTTTTNNQAPAAVPNEGFPSEEELANAADAAADGSAATSVKILQQLEAALSKAVHLGEEALGGVSSVALESLQLTAEGLQKARTVTKFRQFEQFLLSSQALPVSVGLVFGSGLRTVVDALCTDIISPILSLVLFAGGEDDSLAQMSIKLLGVQFNYGHFVEVILQFILTALLLFYLIVLPLAWLGGGNSALKYSPRRPCPTCRELIKQDALKCMFCEHRDPNGLQRRQLRSLRAVVEQIRRQQLGHDETAGGGSGAW